MDTATLLNLKPDPVTKPESLASNTPVKSGSAKKTEDSFKSAYKEQFKADRSVQDKDDKTLPQNGNDLPEAETSRLNPEQQPGNNPSEQSGTEQSSEDVLVQQELLNEEQQKNSLQETLEEALMEGAELESELAGVTREPLSGQPDKIQTLEPIAVSQKLLSGKETGFANEKFIDGSVESLKASQTEIKTKPLVQDGSYSKQPSALSQSVTDFQQYLENSRNKTTTLQPIASVKNFEKNFVSEQVNTQLLAADKSSTLNQVINSATPVGQNNVSTAAAAVTSLAAAQNASAYEVKPGVGKTGWSQAFNNQIVMMAGNGVQQAKLKLNPHHLGPVEVNIKLTKEVAVINLSSAHVSTRDAIDGAIPRLKEMLNENGFSQVDVNVSHQDKQAQQEATAFNRSSGQERSDNEHGNSTMPGDEQLSELDDGSGNGSLLSKKLAQSLNIVDYYA